MKHKRSVATLAGLILVALAPQPSLAGYNVTNLVSDQLGVALHQDPQLVNAWGISSSSASPFWVSDEANGVATLYNSAGVKQGLVVTIPGATGGQGQPTGQVFNGSTTDFQVNGASALFIFAGQDGAINAWRGGLTPATVAVTEVNNHASGASYTGLATTNLATGNLLFAANQASTTVATTGGIDVFNAAWGPASVSGHFVDGTLPAGFVPYNIQNLGGNLWVTYFQPGNPTAGFVDEFDLNGNLLLRLAGAGHLSEPWGVALAPSTFGQFANDILVGNLIGGNINAFDPTTGAFIGTLTDANGNVIAIPFLWGLIFGNGGNGGLQDTLYFASGPSGYAHGLFGSISPDVPEPSAVVLLGLGGLILVSARTLRKRLVS
jgi:uncharacterized protein (TIGR03118 family)